MRLINLSLKPTEFRILDLHQSVLLHLLCADSRLRSVNYTADLELCLELWLWAKSSGIIYEVPLAIPIRLLKQSSGRVGADMNSGLRLQGRAALVTGAAKRLGRHVALLWPTKAQT
jgi:hypothetical protein